MVSHDGRGVFPIHIWRHTFAQEMLEASGHNYELVASLGGWKNTNVLKNHYGKMSDTKRLEGLMIGMGLKPQIEPRKLIW